MTDVPYDSFIIDVSKYKKIKDIGSGRFGSIYLAEKKDDKDSSIVVKYAIREPERRDASGEIVPGDNITTKHLFREVETFIQIKTHPSIIKFYGFSIQPQKIVLEYLEKGSLQKIFDKLLNGKNVDYWNGTMKSKTVFGIACALLHLQNQNAFHRYLTPSSILFDENYDPRLVDFAYSKVDNPESDTTRTLLNGNSPIYQAPELQTQNYDYRVDNFAYGVILYQIITGKEAFNSKQGIYRLQQQIAGTKRPPIPDECPKLGNMINDFWNADPSERPELIYIIKSLNDYDEELFPDTDMDEYRRYRDRIIKSTDLTEEQIAFLNQPKITKENEELFDHQMEEAERGSKKDMVKVARSLEKGIGTERNIGDAIYWYEQAASQGEPEALYKLANFYCIGKPPLEVDNDKYVDFLRQASDKKYPPAINDYAYLLLIGGNGIEADETKAIELLTKMANSPHNFPEAMYHLAQYYEKNGKTDDAIKYYQMARNSGLEAAHCDYALMLLNGTNVEQDIPEGIKILKQAADRGFQMANYNLGYIYEFGKFDQPKNAELSLKYYKTASDKNMTLAMVKYAKAIFKGTHAGDKNIPKDPILAARIFQHAANMGDREGIHCWASFIQNGYGGTPVNINKAVQLYEIAAEKGFVGSMIRLGDLYNLGVSGTRDPKKAKHYYQMAIDNGSKIAAEKLKEVND